jgi:CheY-like chemotaxis protein
MKAAVSEMGVFLSQWKPTRILRLRCRFCRYSRSRLLFATCLLTATYVHRKETQGEIMPGSLNEIPETILVVDDNESVLKVVVAILKRARFHVLSAGNAANAMRLANETVGSIDLLLSDVDMPLMSGPDLGQELKKARPDLHVMLMSGGASGNLLVLNYGWAFIQKPFLPVKLVQMILEVLHSQDRSQAGGQEFDSRKDTHDGFTRLIGPADCETVRSAGPGESVRDDS